MFHWIRAVAGLITEAVSAHLWQVEAEEMQLSLPLDLVTFSTPAAKTQFDLAQVSELNVRAFKTLQ